MGRSRSTRPPVALSMRDGLSRLISARSLLSPRPNGTFTSPAQSGAFPRCWKLTTYDRLSWSPTRTCCTRTRILVVIAMVISMTLMMSMSRTRMKTNVTKPQRSTILRKEIRYHAAPQPPHPQSNRASRPVHPPGCGRYRS